LGLKVRDVAEALDCILASIDDDTFVAAWVSSLFKSTLAEFKDNRFTLCLVTPALTGLRGD